MPFSYAVPLATFDKIMADVDPVLHAELIDRIKTEIHTEISRHMIGPDIAQPQGWARTFFDSVVAHGDLLFYSPLDYEQVVEMTGAPRPYLATIIFPQQALAKDPLATFLMRDLQWRYPNDPGDGLFSKSVNSVLARIDPIIDEFRQKSREVRSR